VDGHGAYLAALKERCDRAKSKGGKFYGKQNPQHQKGVKADIKASGGTSVTICNSYATKCSFSYLPRKPSLPKAGDRTLDVVSATFCRYFKYIRTATLSFLAQEDH
jgi:hypothetical protein